MALDLMKEKGVPVEKQLMEFNWRDMVQIPVSKLDDDAMTKVRIVLMNGVESEQLRFKHVCARMNRAAAAVGTGAAHRAVSADDGELAAAA